MPVESKQAFTLTFKKYFLTLITLLSILTFLNLSPASAHGDNPVTFSPAAYATIPAFPEQISVTFTESISTNGGDLVLLDPSGAVVSNQPILTPTSISATLKKITYQGTYRLTYRVLATDGTELQKSTTYTYTMGQPYSGPAPKITDLAPLVEKPASIPSILLNFLPLFLLPIIFIIFVKVRSTHKSNKSE